MALGPVVNTELSHPSETHISKHTPILLDKSKMDFTYPYRHRYLVSISPKEAKSGLVTLLSHRETQQLEFLKILTFYNIFFQTIFSGFPAISSLLGDVF